MDKLESWRLDQRKEARRKEFTMVRAHALISEEFQGIIGEVRERLAIIESELDKQRGNGKVTTKRDRATKEIDLDEESLETKVRKWRIYRTAGVEQNMCLCVCTGLNDRVERNI